ncbi:hypothetical protein DPMN_105405, partial [Dreissena polymorpha]
LHRSTCDNTESQTLLRRLRGDKERLERDLAQEQEKHRQTHSKIKNITAKLKAEKDELKRIQAVIKDRDVQYKHEVKKKQREVNKLMERLHQLLMDKNPDRRIGMDMVGNLQRGSNKRSTWKHKTGSNEHEDMYSHLISSYEAKHQELRVENSNLRDCLLDMQRELASLIDLSDSVTVTNGNGCLAGSMASSVDDLSTISSLSHDLNDDCLQMPYDIMGENLTKHFQEICKRLGNTLRKCSSNYSVAANSCLRTSPNKSKGETSHNTSGSERDQGRKQEELDKLRSQIAKYKDIVKQQETLIQQSLQTQSKSMENTFLQESHILQERETLSEQRREFYQQKADFEEEKKAVAEMARRTQLERRRFEEEKTRLLQTSFLNIAGSNQLSNHESSSPTKSKADKSRLLPSTPVFSPAPGKKSSPSATDLLKYLTSPNKRSPLKPAHSLDQQSVVSCDSLTSKSTNSAPGDLMQYPSGSSKPSTFEKTKKSSVSAKCSPLQTADSCSSTSARSSLFEPSGSSKGLSIEELEEIKRSLYQEERKRRSSSASLSSLDGN